jgi:hypothetical protein
MKRAAREIPSTDRPGIQIATYLFSGSAIVIAPA